VALIGLRHLPRERALLKLCRAALADPTYRARFAEVHRRLKVQRASKEPRRLLAPIAPLFRHLERDAERILGGDWAQ